MQVYFLNNPPLIPITCALLWYDVKARCAVLILVIRDLSPVNLFRDLERDTICLFLLALKESLIFKQRSYNYEQSEILIIPLLSTQVNIAGSFYDLFIHYYNSLQERVLLKRGVGWIPTIPDLCCLGSPGYIADDGSTGIIKQDTSKKTI